MSRRRRRIVEPDTLRTPEGGLGLEDRVVAPAAVPPAPAAPPASLAARLEAARRLSAPRTAPCRDCWCDGRDAAVRAAVESAGDVDQVRELAPKGLHWKLAWTQGRDAAIVVIEGSRP